MPYGYCLQHDRYFPDAESLKQHLLAEHDREADEVRALKQMAEYIKARLNSGG